MAEITQFIVAFTLGYISIKSASFWIHWGIRVFGVIAIPLLTALFFLAQEPELWEQLGSGVKLIAAATASGFLYLLSALPMMTGGATLGAILAARNARQ